jgi:uncharacterized protein YoxC
MNTQIVLTLGDVGKFVIWGALVAILLYLVFILRRIYIAIKDLTTVVNENRENIDAILNAAPGITKSVEKISGSIADDIAAFDGTVGNVAKIAEKVTSLKNIKETLSKEKPPKNDNQIVIEDD